jgi:hypothetical protein
MTATFATGEVYRGPLHQLTSQTRVDDLEPALLDSRGRIDWHNWDWDAEFVTTYSGRILANLTSAQGDRMHCIFRLVRPASGLAGGGRGKCTLSSGRIIDAIFGEDRR